MQWHSLPEALALHVSTLLGYCNPSVVVSYNIHVRKIAHFPGEKYNSGHITSNCFGIFYQSNRIINSA